MLKRFSRGLIAVLLACAVALPLAPTAQATAGIVENIRVSFNWSASYPQDFQPMGPTAYTYRPAFLYNSYHFPTTNGTSISSVALDHTNLPTWYSSYFKSSALSIPAGSSVSFTLRGSWAYRSLDTSSGSLVYAWHMDNTGSTSSSNVVGQPAISYIVYAQYSDGSTAEIGRSSAIYGGQHPFSLSFTASKTIDYIFVMPRFSVSVRPNLFATETSHFSVVNVAFGLASDLSLVYQNGEQNGLLKGILGGITNVFNFIQQLPNILIDGIKSLFVPSSDSLSSISDDFQSVLAGKLGAVWQIGDFITSTLNGIFSAGSSPTVSFPGISVSLAGSVFSIASASVLIFPPELSALQNAVKLLVTAVFLGAWVVGLQRFLDRILDGGDSE